MSTLKISQLLPSVNSISKTEDDCTEMYYLLRAESVCGDYLGGETASADKAHGVEGDLPYHGVVRNHHGDRTEQHLQENDCQCLQHK